MLLRHKKIALGIFAALALLYLALIAYAYLPPETVSDPRSFAGPDSSFVQVGGNTIHYVQQGSGRPLVLIHGFAGSTYTWRKLTPLLAGHFCVYALDLPGFGLSDKPPGGDYSLAAQSRVVLGFLDKLGIPQATLVGHSMGGVIAAFAAVQRPQAVTKLVLVEPGFYHGKAPSFLRYLFFPLQRIFAKSFYTREGRMRSLSSSFHNKQFVTTDLLDGYLQAAKTPDAVDALAHMMQAAGAESYEGISRRVTAPTLLVWSRHNRNNPLSDAERLSQEIKDAQLSVIEDSGHYIQEEQPEALAEAVMRFVQ